MTIHIDEFRLARILLDKPEKHLLTPIELTALRELISAYEDGRTLDAEKHSLTRRLMRAIADDGQ